MMLGNDALYAKIFVNADVSASELVDCLAACLGPDVSVTRSGIDGKHFSLDVRRNEDFDVVRQLEPDGFVFFRYFIDVDALPGQDHAAQVALVARLLECIWSRGYAAVAACDFEDELPHHGGYQNGQWRQP